MVVFSLKIRITLKIKMAISATLIIIALVSFWFLSQTFGILTHSYLDPNQQIKSLPFCFVKSEPFVIIERVNFSYSNSNITFSGFKMQFTELVQQVMLIKYLIESFSSFFIMLTTNLIICVRLTLHSCSFGIII